MLRTKKYNNEAASYPYVSAIIVAAGNSTRMGGVNKQFLLIDGVPVLIRTLKAFENSDLIKEIIISAREEDIPQIFAMVKDYSVNKVSNIVKGGCTRQECVFNAVRCCMTESDYIAIHDGARPLVTDEIISRAAQAAVSDEACVVGMPVKDTIKVVGTDGIVTATPERSTLMAVQTPQIFTAELLKQAYAHLAAHPAAVTDDASVVELMGHKVATALGRYENIKITTPEDLLFAENLLAQQEQEDGK